MGAATLELALIAPVLMTLIFGGFEYGFLAYSMSCLQFGANVVARDVAVNHLGRANAQASLAAHLPPWLQGDVTMVLTEDHPGDPRMNSVKVEVSALSTAATPLSMVTRLHPWTLRASANVRQELPYVD